MARIKIEFPENILFSLQLRVRITDMNYGNHLGNDALVSLLHEARVAWLQSMGYSELDVAGVGLIMGDLAVQYVNESFYGDQLHISIAAGECSRAGFDIFYLVETTRAEKKLRIAVAKTGMVCFDYTSRKVVAVPNIFKAQITA